MVVFQLPQHLQSFQVDGDDAGVEAEDRDPSSSSWAPHGRLIGRLIPFPSLRMASRMLKKENLCVPKPHSRLAESGVVETKDNNLLVFKSRVAQVDLPHTQSHGIRGKLRGRLPAQESPNCGSEDDWGKSGIVEEWV